MGPAAETLQNGTRVYTDGQHAITTDALLLAQFARPVVRPRFSACDLGSGCGILLLSLLDAGLAGRAVGVELDAAGATLLRQAAEDNGFENVKVHHGSLHEYKSPRPFDMVIANPPYFTGGGTSPNAVRNAARQQPGCTIGQVAAAAHRLLKDRGHLCLCWPAGQLQSAFAALAAANLAPKRMQLVRAAAEKPAWLALIEARKAAGEGLEILPDLIQDG